MPDAAVIAQPPPPMTAKQMRDMSAADRQMSLAKQGMALLELTVLKNPFLKAFKLDNFRQAFFLSAPVLEILYGGCAGSGKSGGLLASALQFVQYPGYSALLLRRTFTDLALEGSLIPMSHEWLYGTKAKWNGAEYKWTFPSGAVLQFGYINNPTDKFRYKSSAWSFIGFDELSEFPEESDYTYLFSRMRNKPGLNIPLRMRAASNPGGAGHDWVKRRFIATRAADRIFVPAKAEDNKNHIDLKGYNIALDKLDPVTRAQLKHGDWNVRPEGNMFKRVWFRMIDRLRVPANMRRGARGWAFAATEGAKGDPDWTVGAKMGLDYAGNYFVFDVRRTRSTPSDVEILVRQTADIDGKSVIVKMEEDIGSAGKMVVSHYQRNVLLGYTVIAKKPTGEKIVRARAFSAAAEQGRVYLVTADWNDEYLSEICSFGSGAGHDDQMDASVTAFEALNDGLMFAGVDGGERMSNVATFCSID